MNVETLAKRNVCSVWCELDECLDDARVDGDDNWKIDERGVVAQGGLDQRRRARSVVASRFPYKDTFDAVFVVGDPELLCGR